MNKQIDKIRKFRYYLLKQIDGLSGEQLNVVPQGHTNNIIWNMAHLVATIQALCYKRSGLPFTIDEKYVNPFLPSTKPGDFISDDEIEVIKNLYISTLDRLETDVEDRLFADYTKSERIEEVYNIDVSNIDDALEFLLYHEGFHVGYILSLKRLVGTV